MKAFVFLIVVVLLACCKKPRGAGEFEARVKSKRLAIQTVVEHFERSGYTKVSYGPPDFVTILYPNGQIMEVKVDRARGEMKDVNASEELKSEVLSYIKRFEDTGIRTIEKGSAIYVGFSEGSRLLISNVSAEEIQRLLHGRPSVEVYPGWYIYSE